MNRLIIATHNSHKIEEMRSALAELEGWSIEPLPASAADVEETGATFIENAVQKAIAYSQHWDALTLADDSGLCIDALDGRPGVHSARYAPTDHERIERVLREMDAVPDDQRHARFVCALAVGDHGKCIWTVERRIHGWIMRSAAGSHGFGYDPIFRIPELRRTMAELNPEEKNRVSHRGLALRELRMKLSSIGGGPL